MTDNTQQARAASIPDAAIEAAAKAFDGGCLSLRDNASEVERTVQHSIALMKAIEAAAPFIAAEAWEKGWVAREDHHAYDVWGGEEPDSSNPYKQGA